MVPGSVDGGHQVGEGSICLQRVDLVEVEELGGREVGVGPLGQSRAGQHPLQLGVEALPVGLGQVGEQQAHGIHPLGQLVHRDVRVMLQYHLNKSK